MVQPFWRILTVSIKANNTYILFPRNSTYSKYINSTNIEILQCLNIQPTEGCMYVSHQKVCTRMHMAELPQTENNPNSHQQLSG